MESAISQVERPPQDTGGRTASTSRSLLVVDCGSVFTKAALIGQVHGYHRLLARTQVATTVAPPVADISIGIREAVEALERVSGRPLLWQGIVRTPETDDASGVDAFVCTTSVGGPIRLWVAGPGREALAGLLHRALGGLFVQLDALPLPSGGDGKHSAEWRQMVSQVRSMHPQALLVLSSSFGGSRGQPGIDDTVQALVTWLDTFRSMEDEAEPASWHDVPVVVSSSGQEGTTFLGALRGHTERVTVVEALSPSTLSPLTHTVSSLYESTVLRTQPGYAGLRSQLSTTPLAGITSLAGATRYLAQHVQTNVVAVDVGATATLAVGATPQGDYLPAVHPHAGVGPGAGTVLRARGYQALQQWLTEPASEDEIREYVLWRMLRPHAIPTTPREAQIEQALAREAIQLALRVPGSRLSGLHPLDVVLGTGGVFSSVSHPAMAALILLDALQPHGLSSLVVDVAGLTSMLGAVAAVDAVAAASVADTDAAVVQLGTVVSLFGTSQEDQPALRATLEYLDGRSHVEDIKWGTLTRLPLATGEHAVLGLYPASGVDVGLGPGQHARATEPVEGGALGIVIDARGRPLALPQDPVQRVNRLIQWQRSIGLEGQDR